MQYQFFIISILLLVFINCVKEEQAIVMAHRGLWGYYPEHSIKGFEIAYFMGADYLETDINLTKDGKLVIIHDTYLDDVTDVNDHENFKNRRKSDVVDGLDVIDKVFISDLTYEELQTLYIKQRHPVRPQIYNKEFKIILIEDLIKMTIEWNKLYNLTTGIYIEPKSPEYFRRVAQLSINEMIFELLQKYNLTDQTSSNWKLCPIVIQSFELESLIYFKEHANLPQIALMTWRLMYNYKELAKYSDGFGPNVFFLIYERNDDLLIFNKTQYATKEEFQIIIDKFVADNNLVLEEKVMAMKENNFINYAKEMGKLVQVFSNNGFLDKQNNPSKRISKLIELGVTGFFSDFCDDTLFARNNWRDLLINYNKILWLKDL